MGTLLLIILFVACMPLMVSRRGAVGCVDLSKVVEVRWVR